MPSHRIYSTEGILKAFSQRFSVQVPTTGQYRLRIVNLTFDDSGIYTCIENAGIGPSDALTLNITGVFEFSYE